MPREIITLQCGECKERNYSTMKNRKTTPDRIERRSSAAGAASTRRIKKLSRAIESLSRLVIESLKKRQWPMIQ